MGERDSSDQENRETSPVADGSVLQVGEFRLDRSARRLTRDGRRVRIQQKPLEVLTYLAEHHERLVTREELLDRFWPRAVNEEALTRCISTIRKHLGDVRDPPRYIETLWGQGYRLIETVEAQPGVDPAAASPSPGGDERSGSDREKNGPDKTFGRQWGIQIGLAALALVAILTVFLLAPRDDPDTSIRDIDRIAVLPISAPDDEDWIASALTDHLIRTISKIEGVTVVARGSASQFSAASDPIEIGERLKVDAVLVSVLDRSQGSSGLRSELVSTADASVLWNFTVEPARARTDEERIRNLARAVAGRLWANLQLREPKHQVDPEAYRHYLHGRYYWNQRTVAGLSAAVESFDAALKLEPDYVDALTGLADSWLLMPLYGGVAPNDAMPKARAAAEKALRLDSGESRAHAVIGVINMQYDWDWVAAESHLRKALTLDPNDATAEQWLGELNCYRARFDECKRHLQLASGLDPLSPVLRMMQGSPALYSGQFEAAVAAYRSTLEELPDFEFTHIGLGHAHIGLAAWDDAIASYETLLPDVGLAVVGGPLIFALAKSGETHRAQELLVELEDLSRERYVPPSKLAIAYLGLGDRVRAIEWLGRAVEARDDRLVYLGVDNLFTELRSDPDFREIAASIGLLEVLGQH
jgi:DNA-binding winged helix-turn-helix (wHTH) protein/tetratricopeptide (TPR) repeat protein/TolB-like protein